MTKLFNEFVLPIGIVICCLVVFNWIVNDFLSIFEIKQLTYQQSSAVAAIYALVYYTFKYIRK